MLSKILFKECFITHPVLLRSIILGKNDLKYAQVHIKSNMTDKRLWKLNIAL